MTVTTANMDVIFPDGENVDVPMKDESEDMVVGGNTVSDLDVLLKCCFISDVASHDFNIHI
jgi:hypothetical protein